MNDRIGMHNLFLVWRLEEEDHEAYLRWAKRLAREVVRTAQQLPPAERRAFQCYVMALFDDEQPEKPTSDTLAQALSRIESKDVTPAAYRKRWERARKRIREIIISNLLLRLERQMRG